MPNLFWNKDEHRLRAFWRLLLQTLLFFLFSGLIQGVILILVLSVLSEGNLMNMPLNGQAIMAQFTRDPILVLLMNLGNFLTVFLTMWIAAKFLDRRPLAGFGLHFNRHWWQDFGFGLGLGVLLMSFIFLAELGVGWITITGGLQAPRTPFWGAILVLLFMFICVGINEEMISRGYLLRNLAEGLNLPAINPRAAILIAYLLSSIIFGMMHLGNPNTTLISTVNLVIAGLLLGFGFLLTGELAIPIGLHITWNFFQGVVYGFPVSGLESVSSLIAIRQGGPEIWTGGAFGPEAGIIGLIAMVLGAVLIYCWVRWQYGTAVLNENIAIYKKD